MKIPAPILFCAAVVATIGASMKPAVAAPDPDEEKRQEAPDPLPGTRLSVDQLRTQMFHISAGQRLKGRWPHNARVAVGISFDVDNATTVLASGKVDYEFISRGEYGAIDGLPRLLHILDRQQVPATFFIPAVAAVLHPIVISDINAMQQKHEIGIHGWIHENLPLLNNEKEEKRLLDLSIETLTKMTGRRPVGYRAPSWKFSEWTPGQVEAAGFLYDSSLFSSDDAYELLLDGKPTSLIELPIERILDDAPYYGGSADGSNPSPSNVYDIFRSEFDVAYEEGGLYLLVLHPHLSGHRSRAAMLERLIEYMKSKPGVWFATQEEIAAHVRRFLKK